MAKYYYHFDSNYNKISMIIDVQETVDTNRNRPTRNYTRNTLAKSFTRQNITGEKTEFLTNFDNNLFIWTNLFGCNALQLQSGTTFSDF